MPCQCTCHSQAGFLGGAYPTPARLRGTQIRPPPGGAHGQKKAWEQPRHFLRLRLRKPRETHFLDFLGIYMGYGQASTRWHQVPACPGTPGDPPPRGRSTPAWAQPASGPGRGVPATPGRWRAPCWRRAAWTSGPAWWPAVAIEADAASPSASGVVVPGQWSSSLCCQPTPRFVAPLCEFAIMQGRLNQRKRGVGRFETRAFT